MNSPCYLSFDLPMEPAGATIHRRVLTDPRRHLKWATLVAAVSMVAACSSVPQAASDSSLPPDQIVGALVASRAIFDQLADPDFGFYGLKLKFGALARRCQTDGGSLNVSGRRQVVFLNKIEASSTRQQYLPSQLTCRGASERLWAASVSYGGPNYIVGVVTGNLIYSAQVQGTFISGDILRREDEERATARMREQEMRDACSAKREQYARRVRSDPKVGMQVAFGMIVELRPPLALVQYDSFGKSMKRVDQEWVPIVSLGPGTDCPS